MTKTLSVGMLNESNKITDIKFNFYQISDIPISHISVYLLVCLILFATRQSKQVLSAQVKQDYSLTLLLLPMDSKLG